MTYTKVLNYILTSLPMFQRIGKSAYKGGLENVLLIDEHLNHPHASFKTIHVAGTNGKGSVSSLLASILMESGLKVGLFTSPHFIDYRERIRVNGKKISRKYVTDFVNLHKVFFDTIQPSFFEMSVGLAFDYFNYKKVDVAIIEVGLGGRLDSTNIITPDLSIITNISLDHVDILGKTKELIAVEKAGIIKPKIPIVIGETQCETEHIFKQVAQKNQSKIYFADQHFHVSIIDVGKIHAVQKFNIIKNKEIYLSQVTCALSGQYQIKNIATVIQAVEQLKIRNYKIHDDSIRLGYKHVLQNTGILGRWQVIKKDPLVVCDMAHNEDGISQLISQVNKMTFKKMHIVIGFVADKNIDKILQLLPQKAQYYFCKANTPRSLNQDILKKQALELGLNGEAYKSVKYASSQAIANARLGDLVLICGSTFVVAEVL